MGVFARLDGSSWQDAAIDALVFGIFSGVFIGFSLDRRRRVEAAVAGDLPNDQLRVARRSAQVGPIPSDPATRVAAQRLAGHELERARRYRKLNLAAVTVALIGGVGLGVSSSPWFFLLVPVHVLGLAGTWNRPRHLERRVEALSAVVGE